MGGEVMRKDILKFKLYSGFIIPLFLSVLLTGYIVYILGNFNEIKTQKLKITTDLAHSLIEKYVEQERNGEIDNYEAKKAAIESVKAMRYREDDYLWINDMTPMMIMHPIDSDLDGKDLSDYMDPTGKKLFAKMVEVVKDEGDGLISYMWPKPGNNEPSKKISYVRSVEHWDWIVGTGLYVDDVGVVTRLITRARITVLLILAFTLLLSIFYM